MLLQLATGVCKRVRVTVIIVLEGDPQVLMLTNEVLIHTLSSMQKPDLSHHDAVQRR